MLKWFPYFRYDNAKPPNTNNAIIKKLVAKSVTLSPTSSNFLLITTIISTLTNIDTASAAIEPYTPYSGIKSAEKQTLIKLLAVSYTHLDVYKRQVVLLCSITCASSRPPIL